MNTMERIQIQIYPEQNPILRRDIEQMTLFIELLQRNPDLIFQDKKLAAHLLHQSRHSQYFAQFLFSSQLTR